MTRTEDIPPGQHDKLMIIDCIGLIDPSILFFPDDAVLDGQEKEHRLLLKPESDAHGSNEEQTKVALDSIDPVILLPEENPESRQTTLNDKSSTVHGNTKSSPLKPPVGDPLDILPSIPGLFRLLDLYTEMSTNVLSM